MCCDTVVLKRFSTDGCISILATQQEEEKERDVWMYCI